MWGLLEKKVGRVYRLHTRSFVYRRNNSRNMREVQTNASAGYLFLKTISQRDLISIVVIIVILHGVWQTIVDGLVELVVH